MNTGEEGGIKASRIFGAMIRRRSRKP